MRRATRTLLAWTTILATGALVGRLAIGQSKESKPPCTGGLELRQQLQPAEPVPPAAKGHYQHLLRQIEVARDREQYGDFYDFGYWPGTSYAGHQDLPPGYWVYLAPNWYIFRDAEGGSPGNPRAPRPWGPEQATGAPDTWPNAGDLTTAWASATPDGQREWLELTYDAPIRPAAVLIYETYNPGAVDRITGYDPNGREAELWSGADPTPPGKDKGISVIPLHPDFDVSRIRVYLDSPRVPGWNEIDAVGLVDTTGKTHWATAATASSTYADPGGATEVERLELRQGAGGEPSR
ncbi:MAG TPA: hypothetical protein VGI81_01985 [Tepidisphaeraceae bacterium]|jgi:hypothetical protein